MKTRDVLSVFNRGLISRRAQARTDISRVALSAEEQTNWMPQRMGPMSLRNGLGYLGNFYNNATGVYVPFVFKFDDTALLELTSGIMRVWDEGETLVTRSSVVATMTNGTFDADLSSWTDDDGTGAASTWATGGYMQLLGTGYEEARRYQEVTTVANVPHSLRIVIERGPVYLRIGSTANADDLFRRAVLRTGTHSIAFTPTSTDTFVEFASPLNRPVLVDSVAFESDGNLELPTPWTNNLHCVRTEQVGDIIFVACDGVHPYRIERRDNNSWSVVQYETTDGPWQGPNLDNNRLTPSALSGEITITASQNTFDLSMIGQLLRLTSQGQNIEADFSTDDVFGGSIRVTGTGLQRRLTVNISGTWSATVSLQRSVGEEGSWVSVALYTTNQTDTAYDDGLDNVVTFYRFGVESGNYTSGTAETSLSASSGSITGTARISAYTSATSVTAIVLNDLGAAEATEVWEFGSWSETEGYPTAVAYYEGRLWWFGRGRIWGSVSDNLTSFDPDVEGDSGPINRAIGKGAVDVVNWAMPIQRLLIGSAEGEHTLRSSSFDEILTPTNFNVKESSTQGSNTTPAARYDGKAIFIQKSGRRVYEMDLEGNGLEYIPTDMTALIPDLGEESQFTRIAVQRQPETRVYFVRANGTAAVMVRDKAEDVLAWVPLETDGEIEDIAVLPGAGEDNVFMSVKRTIDSSTVRFHEKMALDTECRGGTINKLADAAVTYSGTPTTWVQASHLPNTEVVIWGDGMDLGTHTTDASGDVEISTAVENYTVGLTYRARYKSAKLTQEVRYIGSSMTQLSKIDHIGLVLADTHYQGLTYGPNFDTLDNLPLIHNGTAIADHTVWDTVDIEMTEFEGEFGQDTRICIEANAPRPATVMAIVGNHDRQNKAIR